MPEPARRIPARARLAVVGMTAVAMLVVVNVQIAGKERILDEGATVLLRLAPVDPRSLLQGDYMALRYAMAERVAAAAEEAGIRDGAVVIELDERRIAHFVALHEGGTPGEDQYLLRFRKRGQGVRLASDAWFFEEGQWDTYRSARFGELRVAADGEAVLTGLRDEAGERLGEALH